MKAETLFLDAIAIDDDPSRVAFIESAPASEEVKDEVRRLLRAHHHPDEFLEAPIGGEATVSVTQISEAPGTMIGRYKLLQQIGEGGFGVVYMAQRMGEIQQKVAIKIVKPGMDSKEVIARFEAERQALALMDHPSISRVIDAGATETGRPYFVMELVKGVPITDFCDANNMPAQQRLRLFMQVCSAIQHAHQKGIIHRDVKPSNVLVTLVDGEPVPKVIDFGVAKALNQRLTQKTLFTSYGHMIGTPQYMSPEQAELSALDVDTRSDVYSLGVLLYELLTGTTPVEKKKVAAAAFDELRRLIREEEPERPSCRLSTLGKKASGVATKRGVAPGSLRQYVRGDLDWIVLKTLEKSPSRRYDTPKHLCEDIDRFLTTRPISARRPSVVYRTGKLVRRNAKRIAVAVVFALCIGSGYLALQIERRNRPDAGDLLTVANLQYQDGNYESAERRLVHAVSILASELPESASQLQKASDLLATCQLLQGKYSDTLASLGKTMEKVSSSDVDSETVKKLENSLSAKVWLSAVLCSIHAKEPSEFEDALKWLDRVDVDFRLLPISQAYAKLGLHEVTECRRLLAEQMDWNDGHGFAELTATLYLHEVGEDELARMTFAISSGRLRKAGTWMPKSKEASWREWYRALKLMREHVSNSTGLSLESEVGDFSAEDRKSAFGRLLEIFPNYLLPRTLLAYEKVCGGDLRGAIDDYLALYKLGEDQAVFWAGVLAFEIGEHELYGELANEAFRRLREGIGDENMAGRYVLLICLSRTCPNAAEVMELARKQLNSDKMQWGTLGAGLVMLRNGKHFTAGQYVQRDSIFQQSARKAVLAIAAAETNKNVLAEIELAAAEYHQQALEQWGETYPIFLNDHKKVSELAGTILIREAKQLIADASGELPTLQGSAHE